MRQYLDIKKDYKDAVLFFRLGDFYEMFFDEAIEVSRILGLTLTKRNGIPMCGIPYHAYKVYVARLLKAGKKIAICEQVSDPSPGELTKREVQEVITPGIAIEEDFLEQGKDNYLLAVYCSPKEKKSKGDSYDSMAYIDVSSGTFYVTSFLHSDFEKEFFKEIGRLSPSEILMQESLVSNDGIMRRFELECPTILKSSFPDCLFEKEASFERLCNLFGTESLKAFGLEKTSVEILPAALIVAYLEQTSKHVLKFVSSITKVFQDDFLSIDYSTRKNLEITANLSDNTTSYTLLEVVNHTKTSMGQRLLRRRLQEPVCSKDLLEQRLDHIFSLIKDERAFSVIRSSLSSIGDMTRLVGRVAMQKANAKELLSLSKSIKEVIKLNKLIEKKGMPLVEIKNEDLKNLEVLYDLIFSAIAEEPPISINEGSLIKKGFDKEVDRLSEIHNNAQLILEKYVRSEREKTGIQNLKIKYNKVIGYFLEVSKSHWEKAPSYFIKKRSISNSDRYTTEKLEKIVEEIVTAQDSLIEIEHRIFVEIRAKVASEHMMLKDIAFKVAELDVFQSLAHVAKTKNWARPVFTDDGSLKIVNGRHPVVEAHLPKGQFIPNSVSLSSNMESETFTLQEKLPSFAIITGPNMAGKTTFLRQTALIVLLSQIGSYVPADSVKLTPCDKIFCRVGASDNLARGESTFLVEMTETSYILQTATKSSLVIMDEVGRGTSTEDGLSIAQACSEYLLNKIGAKTLFATHYRELTQLQSPALQNLKLDIMESKGKIVFLKKVVEGISKSSYGLHVAALAGLPKEVIERAKNLLHLRASLASNNQVDCTNKEAIFENVKELNKDEPKTYEPTLFGEELLVLNDILNQDLNNLTPLSALQKISEWQQRLM